MCLKFDFFGINYHPPATIIRETVFLTHSSRNVLQYPVETLVKNIRIFHYLYEVCIKNPVSTVFTNAP